MSLFGTLFTLWIGPTVPLPVAPHLLETLERVEVQHSDSGRSGFQLVFKAGRDQSDLIDYKAFVGPQLRPFSRVIMLVTFNAIPRVLFDGVVTNQQLSPSQDPGQTRLTVTGEDVSVMLDLEEKSLEHPGQPEAVIATKIIGSYPQFGLVPTVIPPPSLDTPLPTERTPVQQGTDLQYLNDMAERYAYTFYVETGIAPGVNKAYWGPPIRTGVPQPALSAAMGSASNLININFEYDGLKPTVVRGNHQDRDTSRQQTVDARQSRRIPLAAQSALSGQPHARTTRFRNSGLSTVQASARAQAETDRAQDSVIRGTGELDALRYESILKPRGLVGVRGVGFSYDGQYYVKQVSHTLERGSYRQSFTVEREGLGAISPVVR